MDQLDPTTLPIEYDDTQNHLDKSEFVKQLVIGIPQEYYCEDMSNEVIEGIQLLIVIHFVTHIS